MLKKPIYRELGASGAYVPMAQFNAFVELLLASFYSATVHFWHSMNKRLLQPVDIHEVLKSRLTTTSGHGARSIDNRIRPYPRCKRTIPTAKSEQTIKAFVEATGARYKAGGGFYQLTKSEDISPKKNIVMEHIASGEMFTGEEARSMLGLSATQHKASLRSVLDGYRAFVQSTPVS